MRIRCFILIVSLLPFGLSGCCNNTHVEQPSYPSANDAPGWKDIHYSDVGHSVGKLLLHKGETSDNGSIGVTIVDVIPPDKCAEPGSWEGGQRAVMKLFRPANPGDMCQTTVAPGGHSVNYPTACGSAFGLSAINVYGINSDDKWVHLEFFK